jgi:beta-N-acetylhexosaminidase
MDTLEICHSPELILRAYEALTREAEGSPAFRRALMLRSRDAARIRERMFGAGVPGALGVEQFDALRSRILRFRDRVTKLAGDAGSGSKAEPRSVVETA